MRKTIFVCIAVMFAVCSCDISLGGGDDVNEPPYQAQVAWRTQIDFSSSWSNPFVSGEYGYFPINGANERYLLKINLRDGSKVWRTENLNANYLQQTQKIGNRLFVPLHDTGIIKVFNDDTGLLVATVRLGGNDNEAYDNRPGTYNTTASHNYLIWGTTKAAKGLVRFDTTRIVENPAVIQDIIPEPLSNKGAVYTNTVAENGIIYYLTYSDGTAPWLGAVSENGQEQWPAAVPVPQALGNRITSLIINGNNLYVVDQTVSCYDKRTGAKRYGSGTFEYTASESWLKGLTFHDNKLYYTTGMNSLTQGMNPDADPKKIKNILCVNANDGQPVWGDLVPKGRSIWTNVVVANGRAFTLTDKGLRVNDANNGRLIGVAKEFKSAGSDYTLLYDGMIIITARVSSSTSYLTAIKTDAD